MSISFYTLLLISKQTLIGIEIHRDNNIVGINIEFFESSEKTKKKSYQFWKMEILIALLVSAFLRLCRVSAAIWMVDFVFEILFAYDLFYGYCKRESIKLIIINGIQKK